jgi:hypothetical protein
MCWEFKTEPNDVSNMKPLWFYLQVNECSETKWKPVPQNHNENSVDQDENETRSIITN